MKLILLTLLLFSSLSNADCQIPGEAIAKKDSFNGKEYYKIFICENIGGIMTIPHPIHCLRSTEQVMEFVKRAESSPGRKSSFWQNMKILGFKDRADLEKKLTEHSKTLPPGGNICISGELTGIKETDKKIRDSADYIANLYNSLFNKDELDAAYMIEKYKSFRPVEIKEQGTESSPAQN
jgi:hypothetical protein